MDGLRGLGTDKWYRALAVLSLGLIVGAAAVGDDADLRKALILGGIGGLLVGFGQWIDHPLQERIGAGFKLSGYPYKPSIPGCALTLVGLAAAGRAVWLLW